LASRYRLTTATQMNAAVEIPNSTNRFVSRTIRRL
jgi:hypothetical protein